MTTTNDGIDIVYDRASGLGKQVVESLVAQGAFVVVRNNEAQSMLLSCSPMMVHS